MRPLGRPAFDPATVTLGLDELEALRLADLEGLYQDAASESMGVSRPTFARILGRAREKVVDALLNQKLLLVAGGPVQEVAAEQHGCPVHWGGPRRGRGCHCPNRHRGEGPPEAGWPTQGSEETPRGEDRGSQRDE